MKLRLLFKGITVNFFLLFFFSINVYAVGFDENSDRAAYNRHLYSAAAENNSVNTKPVLDGSFITGDLCYFWSDERWQEELGALVEAGMHYLVIQAVADSYPGRKTTTIYPSSLPNTEIAKGSDGQDYPDVVDACLRNAKEAGLKVFIGIDFSSKWWELYANDSTWLYSQMELDNDICDELWDNYKDKYPNTFYGWYWSYEVENLHFQTEEQQHVLVTAMNKQLDHLIETDRKLPFMWCPFMNSDLGQPAEYENMWKNVFAGLHTTSGDIFCPQDCVGAGGLEIDEVADWFAALRRAVDTKEGLEMWSDVETFEHYGNSFISAMIGRVVSQLQIEQPYVSNYISWEYTYYDSPYKAHSGFHASYLNYVENDSLESLPPTTPENFTAAPLPGSVILNWDKSADNIGVCRYEVYRNGKMIIRNQVPIKNRDTSNVEASLTAADVNITPDASYAYQIRAYDFAGNAYDLSLPVLVNTKSYTNVSLGHSYTVSTPPSDYYPDTGNKKLTDGKLAVQAYYADPQWVGFVNIDSLHVLIDLGQNKQVQYFVTDYLLDPQPSVYLPKKIIISVSNDNVNFSEIGIMTDSTPNETLSSIHKYYLNLDAPLNARFVKFSTATAGSAWLFVDECQVFASNASVIWEKSQKIPKQFNLEQNYPNPFNPTTTIKYAIPKASNVILNVYDMLGQKVATLVEKKQNAGQYEVTFNAAQLTSGVYVLKINADEFAASRKMVLLK